MWDGEDVIVRPAIDIIDGRAVRLVQGDFNTQITYDDAVDAARSFADHGAEVLHVVDLDAARLGEPVNFEQIARIASDARVHVQVGGGIRNLEMARRYLDVDVDRVVIGTAAITDPEMLAPLVERSPECLVVSLDYRRAGVGREVQLRGWTESSSVDLLDAVEAVVRRGVRWILATDISRDGMFSGPDLETYGLLLDRFEIELIASGGVGSMSDVVALSELTSSCGRRVSEVVVGRALHDGRISVEEVLGTWSR